MTFFILAPFALEVYWEHEEMMGNHPIGPSSLLNPCNCNQHNLSVFLHFSQVSAASGARGSSSDPNSRIEVGNVSAYFPFHFVVVQPQVDAGDLLKLKTTDDGEDILVVPTSGRISLARFDAYASMLIICEPWQTSHPSGSQEALSEHVLAGNERPRMHVQLVWDRAA